MNVFEANFILARWQLGNLDRPVLIYENELLRLLRPMRSLDRERRLSVGRPSHRLSLNFALRLPPRYVHKELRCSERLNRCWFYTKFPIRHNIISVRNNPSHHEERGCQQNWQHIVVYLTVSGKINHNTPRYHFHGHNALILAAIPNNEAPTPNTLAQIFNCPRRRARASLFQTRSIQRRRTCCRSYGASSVSGM